MNHYTSDGGRAVSMSDERVRHLNDFGRDRLPGLLGLEILSCSAERVTRRIPVTPPSSSRARASCGSLRERPPPADASPGAQPSGEDPLAAPKAAKAVLA